MFIVNHSRIRLLLLVTLLTGVFCLPAAFAQRGRGGGGGARPSFGGGGARPSMGHMGGGGARPSMSRPSMPRPSMPSRPTVPSHSRPNASRPSFGNVNTRPSIPNLGGNSGRFPSIGGSRPSLGGAGGLPNITRPTTRPSNPSIATRPSFPTAPNRPTIKPPSVQIPSTRPSTGIGQNRPTTLPGGVDRPSLGNINRPTIGGNRPNINLPNIGNNNVVNRPSIGGNRPGIGNDTNINFGNNINIGSNIGNRFPNRPNWDVDPGFSRPSWGLNGGGNWNSNWHDNCINHHHHWYNGCWHGYWGSSWYAPVVWGGIGWGLGSLTNGWGYNYASYYNPYYAEPMIAQSMPYDYSQPVVVNNYISSASGGTSDGTQVAQSTPKQEQALSSFDQGLAKFKAGQYVSALSDFNASLKELQGDAVVHEVRSLALFANGDYKAAAAGLNSLLSSAPGMDWTTMSGLYGNPEDYTVQLRKLEQFCRTNPTDAAAHFVLAYHYLVTESKDAAVNALKVVVKNQPKDVTAKRMLDAMAPADAPAVTPAGTSSTTLVSTNAPETDLVGTWTAQFQETQIELTIAEDSQFRWKAVTKDQSPVSLAGNLTAFSDGISLETKEQGSIGGSVKSLGPDSWSLSISGAPANDQGIVFKRKQ